MPVILPTINGQATPNVETAIARLKSHADLLESTVTQIHQTVQAMPAPLTLAEIQAALSATGSHPLNLTGLQGQSNAVAATNTAVARIPVAVPVQPAPSPPPSPPNPPTPSPIVPSPIIMGATDQIPMANIAILNSLNIAAWPITTKITKFSFQSTGVHVEFGKQNDPNSWPDLVPTGWSGPIQYTLWVVLNIGGQWYGSGVIVFWRGLQQNGGPPSLISANWYYDAHRWAPMTGHQPAVGEQVGFLVTAGIERDGGQTLVQERSNIIKIPFPADSGAVFTYA